MSDKNIKKPNDGAQKLREKKLRVIEVTDDEFIH